MHGEEGGSNLLLGAAVVIFLFSFSVFKLFKPSRLRSLKKELSHCEEDLRSIIEKTKCNPILLRLAWSDAASYISTKHIWPDCGGVNGSIRFKNELNLKYNKGLQKAITLLEKIKEKYPNVSWADLIQMGGATAVEMAGGPRVNMLYGRKDCAESSGYQAKVQNCPAACPPFPDASSSADIHIRNVFYRLGFTNRETVALLGGHTIGRAFSDRTGVCSHSSGEQGGTKYTRMGCEPKGRGIKCDGMMPGGISWTKNWLQFDNSYFKSLAHDNDSDSELLCLPTDAALRDSPEFKKYVVEYASDNEAFLKDYAAAHKKMSEMGAYFEPDGGASITRTPNTCH